MSRAMVARCVINTGLGLGTPARGSFYSTETSFDLVIGQSYPIAAMGIFDEVLIVLVRDDSGMPNWLPSGLFDLRGITPSHWEFALIDGAAASGAGSPRGWIARWGYPEIVDGDQHINALIDREPVALRRFRAEVQPADEV